MELIRPDIRIDFVGKMKMALIASLIMIVISIASIIAHGGLNLGIEFVGGAVVQVRFQKETSVELIRRALGPIHLENSIIQQLGNQEVVIRSSGAAINLKNLSKEVVDALDSAFGKGATEIRKVEVIGPKIGKDLTNKALSAIIFSWIGMLIYIAWRFEFRYAVGGILALVHDTIITIGALSLMNKEFTLTIVAALLTIIGYSINDTIVIFDRIRETSRKNIRQSLETIINDSVSQTLSRTILTSLTVFMVLVILFFLGGEVLHDFAFALLVGVIVGSYSTVFIASPIVLVWEKIMPSKMKRK
ncbi:MAG: protein translocase subunit SecF [Deltaproteobacteria bacterium]|nr:protein translocase subunit SecF [Deltaproteobacteria bacterium]